MAYIHMSYQKVLSVSDFRLNVVLLINEDLENRKLLILKMMSNFKFLILNSSGLLNVGLPAIFATILAAQNFVMAK